MKNDLKIGIVGLGYVGMPLAIAFSKKYEVVGFDLNKEKINSYKNGIDVTNEIGNEIIKNSKIDFTSDPKNLEKCNRIIVAVPTPVMEDKTPDLNPIKMASKIIGENMSSNSIIIYESTVYPGMTEEICKPILEKYSKLNCGQDFKIAYSPERVNPGDTVHKVENIVKIVSGMDESTLDEVAELYNSILENGVYKASSIKVAETAKIIENCQRDVNISFANEIAIICNKLGINSKEVFEAAGTKWNFLHFKPGLVGGHCIGVDPYYLIDKSKVLGYIPNVLISARNTNESMVDFIVENILEKMLKKNIELSNAKIQICGITFKENVNDTRNSKVIDIINQLKKKGIKIYIHDPFADIADMKEKYNIDVKRSFYNAKVDLVFFAVAHDEYKNIKISDLNKLLNKNKILFDIKNIFDKKEMIKNGFDYWTI